MQQDYMQLAGYTQTGQKKPDREGHDISMQGDESRWEIVQGTIPARLGHKAQNALKKQPVPKGQHSPRTAHVINPEPTLLNGTGSKLS